MLFFSSQSSSAGSRFNNTSTLSFPTFLSLAMLLSRQIEAVSWILPHTLAIGISRMDPIVNPDGVANHVHNILGGSNFDRTVDSADKLRGSACSSTFVGADKSAYWAPQLYYRYPDNTYGAMLGGSRIYYFNKGDDVRPFPPNLRMITGNTKGRDENSLQHVGVKINCDGDWRVGFLPNKTSHPTGCKGVSLGIFFPSCGLADGSIDSDDHFSHMTWPTQKLGSEYFINPNDQICPESHPIKYPTIFLEHNYYFTEDQPWRNEDNVIVLSNGDSVGTSYHADFINGWDQDVLGRAIKECIEVGESLDKCAPFRESHSVENARGCRLEADIVSEDVGLYDSLPQLPGCNPLWPAGVEEKPTCDDERDQPGYTTPNVFYRNDNYRINIPLALPEAHAENMTNPDRPGWFTALKPKVGKAGESWIKLWGPASEVWASDIEGAATKQDLKTGSTDGILSNFVNKFGKAVLGNAGLVDKEPDNNLEKPNKPNAPEAGKNTDVNTDKQADGGDVAGKDGKVEIPQSNLVGLQPVDPSSSASVASTLSSSVSLSSATLPPATLSSGTAAQTSTATSLAPVETGIKKPGKGTCRRKTKKRSSPALADVKRGLAEHRRRSRNAF